MVTTKESLGIWQKSVMWPEIVMQTAKAARLTDEEMKKLSSSLAAEVIAATAYISGCTDPDRVSVAHLTTFAGAFRNPELFGHRNQESLSNRLLTGSYFPGGDCEAIKAGMLLLELISLNDHRNDFSQDLIGGRDNPLVSHLDYDEARERIRKEFENLNPAIGKKFDSLYDKTIRCIGWI